MTVFLKYTKGGIVSFNLEYQPINCLFDIWPIVVTPVGVDDLLSNYPKRYCIDVTV